jgi:hypothetical protein
MSRLTASDRRPLYVRFFNPKEERGRLMWDDEERSQEDCAGREIILSSWVIPALILVGVMAWSGIQVLLTE